MMHRIVLLLFGAVSLLTAQSDIWKYSKSATIAGSTAFTIALPVTGSNEAQILDYTLQCTADCTVLTERNGSIPTGTLGTWRPEDHDTAPKTGGTPVQPTTRIYHNSDSTGGYTLDELYTFPANGIVPWGTGALTLSGAGLANNWTVRLTVTGTYHFQVRVRIRRP